MAAIDLVPGTPPGLKGRYSLVILDPEGKVLVEKSTIEFKKLLRLLWEFKPKVLAVDNLTELGKSKSEILKFLNLLPPETDVVQVTRVGGEFVDLRSLAEAAEVKLPQRKLNPEETAYVLAVLALKGIGTKIKAFEEKTKIIVTKARTPRAGGSSLNRFKRATRTAVIETLNEIKKALDQHGFDYDVITKKADGGIESAVITVYAPRKELEGVVKPVNGGAVRVKIRPVVTRHITFADEDETERKYLIVGVDPGIKTGVAVLDLDGNVLALTSSNNMDRGDIVSLISSLGTPLIIASDVNPPPHAVKKLAGVVKADLYVPPSSLSVKEKEEIVEKFKTKGVEVKDSHQRDALAAAYKAWQSVKNKLEKVDSYLESLGLEVDRERVRVEVLRGRPLSEVIEEELAKIAENEEVEEARSPPKRDREEVKEDTSTYLRMAFLEAENVSLKLKLNEMQKEIEKLKMEINVIKNNIAEEVERRANTLKESLRTLSQEVEEYRKRVEELEKKLEEAQEDILAVFEGLREPGSKIERITYATEPIESNLKIIFAKEIEDMNEEFIEWVLESGKILLAEKASDKAVESAKAKGLPILHRNDVVEYNNLVTVGRDVEEEWRRALKEYKKYKKVSFEELERMLLEYRKERWS